jgi:hypothetical protein
MAAMDIASNLPDLTAVPLDGIPDVTGDGPRFSSSI